MVASLDIADRDILDLERKKRIAERMVVGLRVEEFYMGEETGLIQAACWRLWDAKDSCSCAPLCEG